MILSEPRKTVVSAIALAGILSLGTAPVWAQQTERNRSPEKYDSRQSAAASGLIAAEDIKGSRVVDPQNKEVGKITNLFIDPKSGKVQRADVDFSIGDKKEHSVEWNKLKVKEQAREKGEGKQIVATLDESIVKRIEEAERSGNQVEQERKTQQERRTSSQK